MSAWERKLFARDLAKKVRSQFKLWDLNHRVFDAVVKEDFGNDRMTKVEWQVEGVQFQLRITQYGGNICVDPTVILPTGKYLVYKNQTVSRIGYPISALDWEIIEDYFAKDWFPNMQRLLKQYLSKIENDV